MNYLIPITASRHPLIVLGRVFLLLLFVFCLSWFVSETVRFARLFTIEQVASPVLPDLPAVGLETVLP